MFQSKLKFSTRRTFFAIILIFVFLFSNFLFSFLDLSEKFRGAIIFLSCILFITVVLILLYLMLEKGFSCCCCCKKKTDEEESLYTDAEHDDEEAVESQPVVGDDDELLPPEDSTIEEGEQAVEAEEGVPEIIVTEGHFVPEKKSKRKQISGMFKKMKRGKGKVRFSPSSEQISMLSSEGTISTSDYGSTTNSLQPLHRSDSMESFMSAISSVTMNNLDEFGDELSPSRVQVFVHYDAKLWTLTVGAKQADCLVSTTGGAMYWQAHITLLPFKKHRFKTKYKSSSTPIFNQNYEIENIAQQALAQLSVRYRIYGRSGRGGRKKLAGETEVELSAITQMEDMIIKDWRVLRRRGGPFVRHESEV